MKNTASPKKKNASTNPLYVVKKDHIEEAKNYWDLFLKRTNLNAFVEALMELWKALLSQLNQYAMIKEIKILLDRTLLQLESFLRLTGMI